MRFLSFIMVSFFLFYSCGAGSRQSPEQQKEGEKWDAVMANHDIVMPMMDKTHALRKRLKAYLKEQTNKEGVETTKAKNIINLLNKADDGMMDWMQGFKKLGELQGTMSHAEILIYLDGEDQAMAKVKDLFDLSLKQGEDFLTKN